MPSVGKNIKQLRGELSQEKFVIKLSLYGLIISRQTLSSWENDITEPSLSELSVIARTSNRTVDFFLQANKSRSLK